MAATTASRAPPESLTLHARSRVLELAWPGGAVHRLPFELLRVCSPSAEVQGHGPGQETLQTGKREVAISALALAYFDKQDWDNAFKHYQVLLVHHKDDGGGYALSFEVRRLSEGYASGDWIDEIAAPVMLEHLRAISWPSDLATPDGGFMIVRESTHRHSMLSQHRATIGIRIPMLVSSLGRAWLAYCSDEEREATLSQLRQRTDDIGEMARDTRRGYGMNTGEWLSEAGVTAIALPIFDGKRALGAINIVMMRDAVQAKEIRARYLPLLEALAQRISREIGGRRALGAPDTRPAGRTRQSIASSQGAVAPFMPPRPPAGRR